MRGRVRSGIWFGLVLAVAGLALACGDEGPTGPQFGDITFTPSFISLAGDARDSAFVVRNRGSRSLGPVSIGLDVVVKTAMPDSLCLGPPPVPNLTPSSITSLAAGAEQAVDFLLDMSGVDPGLCTPGQYDALIFAAVGGQVLGGATIRFNWDGTPP